MPDDRIEKLAQSFYDRSQKLMALVGSPRPILSVEVMEQEIRTLCNSVRREAGDILREMMEVNYRPIGELNEHGQVDPRYVVWQKAKEYLAALDPPGGSDDRKD